MKKQILPVNILLLIVLALIWGSSYFLMKRGLVTFSAMQVAMLRIIFAAIALLPFLPKAIKNINRRDLFFALVVGVLGSGIPTYLYPLAITKIDSSITGIINALTPVFTVLFGWAFFQMKATPVKLLGIGTALFGASLLILQGADGIAINQFALIAVLATMCYGFSGNVLKTKLNHVKAAQLTSLTFAMICPVAIAILFTTDFMTVVTTHEQVVPSMIYIAILGVFGTAFALVLFNLLIKRTDALYASSVTFLIPIVALAWGFYDGENIGWAHFVGLAAILVGVYMTNKQKQNTKG
ncbi:MAG: DMT family transporter [Chitinophagales bacterium]